MTGSQEYKDYLTNDMGIVAFLRMSGHEPQHVEYDGNVCRWRFLIVGDFMTKLEEFQTDTALVNPREYNKYFGLVKKDLHKVLDDR